MLVGLLAFYVVARLLALPGLTVFTSFDSASYAPRPGVSQPFDTLSLTGDAPRTWGVPLLYSVVGSDTARVLLQWVVGTVAWSVLVIGLWVNIRTLPARIVAAVGVIGLALTSVVYTWDFAILSESLSISLGVVAFGLFAIWVRTGSWAAAVGASAAGVWWTFTRPDVLPYVVVFALVVCGYVLLRADRRRTAGVILAALLVGAGWYAATVSRNDNAFRKWGLHLSLSESTFVYRLRLQVYPDPQVLEVYTGTFEMPACPAAAHVAKGEDWAIERFVAAYRACPALVAWTARERRSVAARYAFADPGHFARLTEGAMAEMLRGTAYASESPALPAWHDSVYFPPRGWVLRALFSAFLLTVIAVLATGAFRRRARLTAAGAGLVVVSGASALVGTLYSAGEYPRFGIQESVLMRVGLIVMLAAAVDAALTRRTEVGTRRLGA